VKKLFLILALAFVAGAANVCVLDGGTGDGSAWNNALDALPVTFVRGNTYYVGDGVYAGVQVTTPISGTTIITIKKATIADHGSDVGWSDEYGDGQARFTAQFHIHAAYVTVDGNSPDWAYGFTFLGESEIVQAMLINGTDPEQYGGVIVKSVNIDLSLSTICLSAGTSTEGLLTEAPHTLLSNLKIVCIEDGITMFSTAVGTIVEKCYFEKLDYIVNCIEGKINPHGDAVDLRNIDSVTVRNCKFNWDSQNLWHSDGNGTPYYYDGCSFYGNVFYGGVNTQVVAAGADVHISNMLFYNNTIYNVYLLLDNDGNYLGGSVKNNVFYGYAITPEFGTMTHDYNYYGVGNNVTETNGTNNDEMVFIDTTLDNYHLSKKLNGVYISGMPDEYYIDIDGKTRGSDNVYDIGAYEYDEKVCNVLIKRP
jgi:hypothetical protein